MNKSLVLLLLVFCVWFSCEKQDPCDCLVNGVYQFPELPENHGMTSEEVADFWDLPEDICKCITTEGLIETCLNYPELRLIMAGANPQSGYDGLVKSRFRGIRELESRPDRGTCLLKKYLTIDPLGYDPDWSLVDKGAYNFNIYKFEIIFSQYVNLEVLTTDEEIALIEKTIDLYDKMKEDIIHYGLFGLECTIVLSGRLMYLNKYEPMVNLYNSNVLAGELVAFFSPSSYETAEQIYHLSKEYLNHLKENQS